MTDFPFLSVIVPYYNAGGHIRHLLQALSRQSYPHDKFEVILVNNGSNDDSLDIIKAFLNSENDVTFHLSEENKKVGSYAARNKGISQAQGQIFAFTDADCIPEAHWIESGVISVCCDGAPIIGGEVELRPFDQKKPTPAELFDLAYGFQQRTNIERKGFSVTANLFAKREVFEAVGTFDENLKSKGDYEWCTRAASHGFSIVYQPSCRVTHPARRRLSELVAKTRRIAGGQHDIRAPEWHSLEDVNVTPLPLRLVTQLGFVLRNREIRGIKRKACVIAVGSVLILVKYIEKARLKLGRESRRS